MIYYNLLLFFVDCALLSHHSLLKTYFLFKNDEKRYRISSKARLCKKSFYFYVLDALIIYCSDFLTLFLDTYIFSFIYFHFYCAVETRFHFYHQTWWQWWLISSYSSSTFVTTYLHLFNIIVAITPNSDSLTFCISFV